MNIGKGKAKVAPETVKDPESHQLFIAKGKELMALDRVVKGLSFLLQVENELQPGDKINEDGTITRAVKGGDASVRES